VSLRNGEWETRRRGDPGRGFRAVPLVSLVAWVPFFRGWGALATELVSVEASFSGNCAESALSLWSLWSLGSLSFLRGFRGSARWKKDLNLIVPHE